MVQRKRPQSKLRPLGAPRLEPGDPVWAYLRHSPGDDQDIRSQRRGVDEFARARALVVTQWFVDEALTGSTVDQRRGFEAMLAASRTQPPPVRAIVVWKLNRLARNDLESQFFMADLRLRGYEIVSISDDIPSGEFASVVEAFIRWKDMRFLVDLQSDVMRGLDAVVADRMVIEGVERTGFSGGGRPPMGYVPRSAEVGTKPSGKPITRTWWAKTPDPDLRARVELAWSLAVEAARLGRTPPVREIHERTGLYTETSSYYDFLRTRTYAGSRLVGARRVDGAHEPYVSLADFEAVQQAMPTGKLSPREVHPKRARSAFLLSGLVFCGYCGGRIDYERYNRLPNYVALRCATRKRASGACRLMRLSHDRFMEAVFGLLRERVFTEAAFTQAATALNLRLSGTAETVAERRRALVREISAATRAIEQLARAQEAAYSVTVQERIVERERERARKEAELSGLAADRKLAKSVRVSPAALAERAAAYRAELDSDDPEVLRRLLRAFIVRVELTNEAARVDFTVPAAALGGAPIRAMVGYPQGEPNRCPVMQSAVLVFPRRRKGLEVASKLGTE